MKNNKSRKKTIRDTEKSLLVKKVAENFGVDKQTVYRALRGDSDSDLSGELKAEYSKLEKQLKEAFSN